MDTYLLWKHLFQYCLIYRALTFQKHNFQFSVIAHSAWFLFKKKKKFHYAYWKSRIFTHFKCVFSVKIHNFLLRHWFDLKSNWILWNNNYHFNTSDFVVFSYWKLAFFLSKNLCKCTWCFWKYHLLKKLGEDLPFPFSWILLQLSIVPFPHAWWAIKLLTHDIFPRKRSLKQESNYVRSNPFAVCAQSQHRNSITWFTAQQHHSESSSLSSCNGNHLNGCFFKNMDIE